jgi:hypothetical protein
VRRQAAFLLLVGSSLLLFSWLLFFGTGCAGTANVVKALAKDTNSVSVKVTTPWGSLDYQRDK